MPYTDRSCYWGPCTQFGLVAFPEQRALAEQRGWKVDGQEEVAPTTGTRHIQFWVKTPQVRESEVRSVFQGAHVEKAVNPKKVMNYCKKEATRSGVIPQASDKYPNQDKLFKLFGVWIGDQHIRSTRWLYDDDGQRRRNVRGDIWLQQFDQCCGELIEKGYRVESLAVNPAVRSAIKKFGNAIFERYIKERDADTESRRAEDRQTDRQAEIISVPVFTDENASRREDNESGSQPDGSPTGEDFEDDFSTASEGHSQSPDDDDSEESGGTSNTE